MFADKKAQDIKPFLPIAPDVVREIYQYLDLRNIEVFSYNT